MSYIQRSLGDGERIVGLARFHWLYSIRAWLAIIVPIGILLAVVLYADETNRDVLMLGALALLVLGIVIFLKMMIRKWTTEIGITSHRFVKKTGWVSLHTDEIALPNIEGVKVTQGFWGRVWGYGHLRVEGTGVDAVELPTIDDPVGFRRAIETAKGIKD
jgi:uncharacterized membrane protein YdbT with pleckstrin-like domain